jgi:hypothetical protein
MALHTISEIVLRPESEQESPTSRKNVITAFLGHDRNLNIRIFVKYLKYIKCQ